MHFTDLEIELARTLKSRNAIWNPTPGQFVLDDDQVFHHTSPFQPHVFFILDLQHFLRYTGTTEEMKRRMVWLPTWHDAREELQKLGLSHQQIADHLRSQKAIEEGRELESLLRLWIEKLPNN